jgi:hypothetical protein
MNRNAATDAASSTSKCWLRQHCSLVPPAVRIALGAAVLLTGLPTRGEEIRISNDCKSGVHLVAREARVSEILKQLARTLDFELRFESQSDPRVTVDAAYQLSELLMRVAPSANVSMTQMDNPRCPGQLRVVKVWVLPEGNDGQGGPPLASNVGTTSQAALEAKGIEMVLKAHGVDASGEVASHD